MADDDDGGEEAGRGRLLSRRQALVGLGVAGAAVGLGGALLSSCGDDDPPNILLIVADDMRYDHQRFMPNVKRLIADRGTRFRQARCNVALCQPSRVGLLTGQMSKHNGELGVGFGGTTLTDRDNCLGKWMHDAGYRCGFFGKYVNFNDGFGGVDAPAGYEVWREFLKERSAYEFDVHRNSDVVTISGTYPTNYLAAEANRFIARGGPFFCIVTPTQPHEPFRPRADFADAYADFQWPILDEEDVSDKPPWIQALRPLSAKDKVTIREDVRGALRELLAVDDMVARIVGAMDPDVLAKTVVVFTSDNGVHHGEHRRRGAGTKAGPYEVGQRVPMLVRGPGFPVGNVDAPVLAFQDLATTVLALGGGEAGRPHQVGRSLVDVRARPGAYADRLLLHEIGEGFEGQTGDGISTGPASSRGFRKLFRYPSVRSGEGGPYTYEAYDLDDDPDELSNWANDPARRAERDALEADLVALLDA